MRRNVEIASALTRGDLSVLKDLSPEEQTAIMAGFRNFQSGEQGLLDALWSVDYESQPPTIDQILTDEKYLGRVGVGIFPAWRQELRIVTDPAQEILEWIVGGGIGTGKTTVAVLALLCKIIDLLHMKAPAKYYGQAEGSVIVFGLFNVLKYLAKDTSYKKLVNYINLSPYLSEHSHIKQSTADIDFDKGISIVVGSQAINALGQDLMGGLMDEVNFGRDSSLTSEDRSQVVDLYLNVRNRMESRFMQAGGKVPGFLCLVSSARAQGDFLDKHIQTARNDPSTRITNFATWDVKERFKNSARFFVQVGTREFSSKILDRPEDAFPGAQVIAIPVEYKKRFMDNLDACLQDVAGVATYGKSLLIPRREMLFECVRTSTARVHPFHVETLSLSIEKDDPVSLVTALNRPAFLELVDKSNNRWRPLYHPSLARCVHVDLAKNRDCAGIAMSAITQIRRVERYDTGGQRYVSSDLVFWTDFALRIRAVPGSQIDFRKIREFIFYLREVGFRIVLVTYDGFQSVESLQELYKGDFEVKDQSIDKKPIPYHLFRTIIVEGRWDVYSYAPLIEELGALEDRSREIPAHKPPIDHPENGSKDVADAVCGSIYDLITLENTEAQMVKPGRMRELVPERADIDPIERVESWLPPNEVNALNDYFPEDE